MGVGKTDAEKTCEWLKARREYATKKIKRKSIGLLSTNYELGYSIRTTCYAAININTGKITISAGMTYKHINISPTEHIKKYKSCASIDAIAAFKKTRS